MGHRGSKHQHHGPPGMEQADVQGRRPDHTRGTSAQGRVERRRPVLCNPARWSAALHGHRAAWRRHAVGLFDIERRHRLRGLMAMRIKRHIKVVVTSSTALLLLLSAFAFAQRPASSPPTRDISGFWTLSFDSRKVPAAKLLPRVTRAMLDLHARRDVHAIRWCNLLGVPAVMDSGSPLDIRQGSTTIVIAPENNI